MRHCAYHCRECGGHFTSLEAFDAHKPPWSPGEECEWPEDAPLVEVAGGFCEISDGIRRGGLTLHEHRKAQTYRNYRKGLGSRESAETQRKQAVPA